MLSFLRRSLGAWLPGVLLLTAGCDSGLPKVYPVKGKVVSKGRGNVKDLAGYSVQFQSVSDPAELPGGPIGEDGDFTLFTRVGGRVIPGAKEGTYKACLVQPTPEGRPPPPLVIPRKYIRFETANLEFAIKPGENEITIEVER